MFSPSRGKPFVATKAAIEMYRVEVIIACLRILQYRARQRRGLDYLQVFESQEHPENLWFIEDAPGGKDAAFERIDRQDPGVTRKSLGPQPCFLDSRTRRDRARLLGGCG